jgi:hypothetical protein
VAAVVDMIRLIFSRASSAVEAIPGMGGVTVKVRKWKYVLRCHFAISIRGAIWSSRWRNSRFARHAKALGRQTVQ